jgi:type VI secretion system secreted protein VgrG
MAYTQENRLIALETPLGKDELILTAFRGAEGISRLFSFELVAMSHNRKIAFEEIVGKGVTISVKLADGAARYFHGIVSRFSQTGAGIRQDKEVHLAEYRLTVVPWFWLLGLTENSKIFQDKSVPDIVEEVFGKRGFTDYVLRLHGSYDKRGYCVQYRESDFQFASRLLEDEGIHYFFEHEKGKHTLVLADDPAENKPCPLQKTARYAEGGGGRADEDRIQEFQKNMEVMPTAVALNDYNFEVPNGNLKVDLPTGKKTTERDCEIYDYPGGYDKRPAGDRLVNIRMQEEEARISVCTGVSDCRAFTSGQRFEIKEHYRADLTDKQFVLTQIVHDAMQKLAGSGQTGEEAKYRNQFACIPFDVPFRPIRGTPRPFVRGTQTAVVTGPSGEEIHTDEHGRIKVLFHWDRLGKKDDKSSCWIRVAQVWAGPGWGGVFIPRIGQEVIVDFLEGDPDRPIVIGAVYNGANAPPYSLPGEKTRSTVKSESTIGGGGFNELRFEDKKGSEEIFLHGQKDWTIAILNDKNQTVGHDETLDVGNNRTKTVGVNQKETIGVNKTISVGANHTETIGANMSLSVGSMKTETVGINSAETIGAAKELTIGAAYQITVGAAMNTTVGAAKAEEVGGAKAVVVGGTLTETIGSNMSVKVGGNLSENIGGNLSEDVGKDYSLKAAKKVIIEAGDEITLKTGQATIVMKKSGDIKISGKKIEISGTQEVKTGAMKVTSEASTKSVTKGAMVDVEASGIMNIKGALVKIN